ncbi:MAG: hypothetical protein A2286_06375 [Gammaproteobacteria bacterium RIFOXYA12_FULL_61_12]|nr:MAG: hypothetical protein A2514_00665 [Gammaproteobacteria bacterium RIFOXYD12_FULL_61_37]OGT93722.1 MAG: hypothetical protein A2286_06375 [Gammaproteobacteria bacterium RIFOXYA12_FULL_61_12]
MTEKPGLSNPLGGTTYIVVIYAAFGALWILLSDEIVALLISEPAQIVMISMLKGWFYIAVTSLLLYGLLRRHAEAVRRTEESLHESETRFRDLFDNMSDGVAIYETADGGADFHFVEHNKGGECITGLARESVIGRSVREAFPGIESMGLLPVFQRVWRSGEPEYFPVTQYCDDKLNVWVDNYVFRLPSGKVVAIYRDVTQRRRAEDEMRESEAHYRSVVDNLKEVVFQTDAQGIWTFLNRSWTEITGFPVQESLGTLFLDYVHPEDRQRNQELFEPLIQRKKEYCRHEIRYLHKNGGFRWIEVFARLTLDDQDRIIGTSGTLSDISIRKYAEEALRRQAEELIERNAELVRFNSAMIGRELDMIEMKKRINELSRQLGLERPYPLAFLDEEAP